MAAIYGKGLFADDTNVFLSHKDADCLASILNTELNKLSILFRANKLSLNLKKTKFMVFKPSQKRKSHDIQLFKTESGQNTTRCE